MKGKLLSFVNDSLQRMCLLIVMVLAGLSASAQGSVTLKTLELNTIYNENNIYGVNDIYKFTPETDGTLVVWSQDAVEKVYSKMNADGTDVDYESYCSSFSYASADFQGTSFSKKETASVKAGNTYYLVSNNGFSKDKKFIAVMETITELTFECDQPLGQMFDITDGRDGQATLTFNLPITSDQWAYLKVGSYPQDPENGKVEVRSGNISEQLIVNLKEYLTNWKEEGRYKAGDPVTLTLTGVKSRGEDPLVYGTDGTLVLNWTAPGDLHKNTGITKPDPFLSYWLPGDERGIMVLDFDYPLMTMEDGQTATASLTIGSADMGDAYQEKISQDKISVDGQKLYIDFTGVRRTYADMGLTMKWGSLSIKVSNIKMADGTMCFSPSAGNFGSVSTGCVFEEYKSDIQAEFTPADGATLTDKFFKVYFSDKNALTFSGVRVTYQTQDDVKYQTDITEGITSTEEGKNGIEYTIPLTEEIVAGKNVRVSFLNQVSNDGFDHNFNVRYNPGPELADDLEPTSVSVADNAIIPTFDKLTLTFDENVNINMLEGGVQSVRVEDLTTNKVVNATITADGNTVTVTPEGTLLDTHKYNFYINFGVIVNDEYVKTEGKYGRYMKGKEINFTLFRNYDLYDFMTDPIAGSTVRELRVIKCTQKEGTDSYYNAISPTRREDKGAYVIDSNRQRVTTCKIGDDIVSGFTLTLEEPITTSGEYTVVIEDSVYNRGEGYGVETNDKIVYLKYTVLSAPQATITVESSDPVSETTVESISEVMIEFSDEVYGPDATVYFYDPVNYKQYPATFQVNPKNRRTARVSVEEPITEAGNYRLTLDEGLVGDQTWNNSGYLTGNINVGTTLFFSIGGGSQGGDDSQWKTDPENGSTVTSLKTIHVWNTTVEEMGCGSGKVTVKKDGTELEKIADAVWGNDLNELVMTTSKEYTEDGTYTFEVPEGFFVDGSGNALPAVTFTYTIGNGGGEVTSDWKTDPADGSTVTSLKTIHVWNTTVAEMGCGAGKVTVKRDGVELEKISDTSFGEDMNELILTTSKEYTEDGTYTFEAPEGFFVDGSGNALPAVTFTYTIGNGGGGSLGVNVVTDPENNSTVTELKKIVMTFVDCKEVSVGAGKITVKKDGVEVAQVEAEIDWAYDDWNILKISYPTKENGVYTFEVPAGHIQDENGNPLPAFTLTYTVKNDGNVPDVNVVTDPENKSTVTSLSTICILFPDYTEVGMSYNGKKISVKKNGEEIAQIDTYINYDDQRYNTLYLDFSATEDGVYTFDIPEGYVWDLTNGYMAPENVPAFTLTYYIGEASGIGNINADADEKVNVYSLDGKTVKMNATKEDIKSLRGLYIINGKKVVIKK
ncbi:MAG: Ig-like domain-containing protein [Prevotella sp.]